MEDQGGTEKRGSKDGKDRKCRGGGRKMLGGLEIKWMNGERHINGEVQWREEEHVGKRDERA